MKEPWEETSAWKSKSAFFTWVRGNLRKALWQHFPTRNEYKKENTWSASNQEILDNKLSKRVKRVPRHIGGTLFAYYPPLNRYHLQGG